MKLFLRGRLGTLRIDGPRMIAEVNSQRRAKRICAAIEKRLGDRVAFKTAVMESLEKALEERKAQGEPRRTPQTQTEHDRLMAIPEVREHVKRMIARHYEQWLDDRVPALRDQTPREAVRTPEGRERVEALLHQLEWSADRDPVLVPDIAALRRELGL